MQQNLAAELGPFLCSGSHVFQKDCHPSAIHTFLEAATQCMHTLPVPPGILKYLGKTHNLWHRAVLTLEQMAYENGLSTQLIRGRPVMAEYEFEPVVSPQQQTLDALCELYSLLKEDDMLTGIWRSRAKYHDTNVALAYEQHGFFEKAQQSYEAVSDPLYFL